MILYGEVAISFKSRYLEAKPLKFSPLACHQGCEGMRWGQEGGDAKTTGHGIRGAILGGMAGIYMV